MDEYISREAALACFHDWIDKHGDVHTADEMPEYRALEALPAAMDEYIEIPDKAQGHWIPIMGPYLGQADDLRQICQEIYAPWFKCSICGEESYDYNYCPNCGAKMDGGDT